MSERPAETYSPQYVEALSDARTKLGKGRVLARLGWMGEVGLFSTSCLEMINEASEPEWSLSAGCNKSSPR